MREALRRLQQYLRFLALPGEQRRLVVYSEGPASWPHLGPVVRALLAHYRGHLVYVSSASDDPGVALTHPRLQAFVIGDGHVRTMFFAALQTDLLLMTMPDLNTFHIKRSARTRHCVYLHHSMVSSHMAYRAGAFDHFDTILCAGPHHAAEIRAIEAQRGLPAKDLVAHGYGRLDAILAAAKDDPRDPDQPLVLVAPSWGPDGLLERHADDLMRGVANSDWQVIVRPHPQTLRLAPEAINCVRQWCARSSKLRLETGVVAHDSLRRASVMVSDWSGAAFDFALGLERPVLFVDVPRKVNNPDYLRLGIEPIEVFARTQMGRVLGVAEMSDLPHHLATLRESGLRNREAIRGFRRQWVHHVGESADVAAGHLVKLMAQLQAAGD